MGVDEARRHHVASRFDHAIGLPGQTYEGTHAAGAHWSPDDQWILFREPSGGASVVDPDGETPVQPSWIAAGGESIQRVAP